MSFKDMLEDKSSMAYKQWFDSFVNELKPELLESAKKGYNGYEIYLNNREDTRFFKEPGFEEKLSKSLGGCEVFIEKREYNIMIINKKAFNNYLVIRWQGDE